MTDERRGDAMTAEIAPERGNQHGEQPRLYASERGTSGTPIVLLHGFAGNYTTYDAVIEALGERRTIAYDLPGHGRSRDWPETGHALAAARAVTADLGARDCGPVHLVGHSMGGAAATLIALKAPELLASLTLLAPGGFGHEVNQRLLRRYAVARSAEEIMILTEQFFGWRGTLPDGLVEAMVAERSDPAVTEGFAAIVEAILDGDEQKVLPRKALGSLPFPVKVIWGTQDRVLPTRHAHNLPGRVGTHVFDDVGHMPQLEIPEDVAALILQNAAGR